MRGRELEVGCFCDESGSDDAGARYYLLTLVFHDQSVDLGPSFAHYERSLADKGLPDIPLHTSPLMNGHGDYEGMALEDRKRLLMSFVAMAQRLPVTYHTFSYRRSEFGEIGGVFARLRRDMVDFFFDNLAYFQSFDRVRVYYDGGQSPVRRALHGAVEYALAKEAVEYRSASYEEYRLSQAADLLCTLELTSIKYRRHEETPTDRLVFGDDRRFWHDYLRKFIKKRI